VVNLDAGHICLCAIDPQALDAVVADAADHRASNDRHHPDPVSHTLCRLSRRVGLAALDAGAEYYGLCHTDLRSTRDDRSILAPPRRRNGCGQRHVILSAWTLAGALGIDGTLRLSLLPRSISTPFAMAVSGQIGGIPELTAVFVIATGILGALLGEIAIQHSRPRNPTAQGAMVGVTAHAIGTAQIQTAHPHAGAIAGLSMVLTGLLNLALTPVALWWFHV
jgi:hypothetical protein